MSSIDGVPRDRRRVGEDLRLEQQHEPERDDQQLQREVAQHERTARL